MPWLASILIATSDAERNQIVSDPEVVASSDRNHYKLLTGSELVAHGCGPAAFRQRSTPEFPTGLDVISAEPAIQCGANEYDPARRRDRTAKIR